MLNIEYVGVQAAWLAGRKRRASRPSPGPQPSTINPQPHRGGVSRQISPCPTLNPQPLRRGVSHQIRPNLRHSAFRPTLNLERPTRLRPKSAQNHPHQPGLTRLNSHKTMKKGFFFSNGQSAGVPWARGASRQRHQPDGGTPRGMGALRGGTAKMRPNHRLSGLANVRGMISNAKLGDS
ncbi:MAG: hypothetical protein JWQ04_2862 [Pedosphaera sp.]|nr:hypothetical protein [Pedosphaera sp.]